MSILLKDIDKDNWVDCIRLKVAEHQKNFVAANAFSLAQSKYEPECVPMGIYEDETMIGFVMFSKEFISEPESQEQFWICRFMVDEKFQGKGLGRAAMAKIIQHVKSHYDYDKIYLSEVPGNDRAKALYQSFGFVLTGEIIENEEVMRLNLK